MSKKISKKNQKKTLKKMKETRNKDSIALRNIIQEKHIWAIAEKQKGLGEQKKLQAQIHRLEGIILFCKDILEPKEMKN